MKRIFKIMIWIVIVVVVFLGLFLLYITLTDYKPDKVEVVYQGEVANPVEKDTFELISWNIGYAGLGAEMDFFYDDGKKVRPTKELARKYLDGIKETMTEHDPDFWLLQEIDVNAKRSHGMNEVAELKKLLDNYHSYFVINYKVPFVPLPLYAPMGHVEGGMLTMTAEQPSEVVRFAYPLIASWPNRYFLLDRCFIIMRVPLTGGKDLIVINTHNSAYVYDSVLRNKELEIIKDKMLEEYEKGNYVVAGGDWNANPPGFKPENGFNGQRFVPSQVKMPPGLMPGGWSWAFDPTAPTNRNNDKAFVKGENGTTILDYFVASPNVEIIKVKTFDLNFENSDHNPVWLKIKLK